MGKTSPSGKGSSIASRRADENLHMRAMAEKSLCPMIFLENGCVEGSGVRKAGCCVWENCLNLCEGCCGHQTTGWLSSPVI